MGSFQEQLLGIDDESNACEKFIKIWVNATGLLEC